MPSISRLQIYQFRSRANIVLSRPTGRRTLTQSPRVWANNKNKVPVATYANHDREQVQRTVLAVNETKSCSKATPAEDVSRTALPFNKTLMHKVTPTIRSFTLEGKVALVTGCVISLIYSVFYVNLRASSCYTYYPFIAQGITSSAFGCRNVYAYS